jgi:cytochrome c biogenesis protein CcdA
MVNLNCRFLFRGNKLIIGGFGLFQIWCKDLDQKSVVREVKRHRSSALIDGICMGVGFVFVVLGILFPVLLQGQLINGLLAIIGGILIAVIGGMMEIYHWAKLH